MSTKRGAFTTAYQQYGLIAHRKTALLLAAAISIPAPLAEIIAALTRASLQEYIDLVIPRTPAVDAWEFRVDTCDRLCACRHFGGRPKPTYFDITPAGLDDIVAVAGLVEMHGQLIVVGEKWVECQLAAFLATRCAGKLDELARQDTPRADAGPTELR